MLFKDRMEPPGESLNQYTFQQLVESNQIVQATINYSPQSPDLREITGKYTKMRERPQGRGAVPRQGAADSRAGEEAASMPQFEPREPNTMLFSFMLSVLPIIVIAALIWFFFIRQIKMAGKGALSFGKSKARLLAKERNKTTFKDVAGIEEAIEEVSELVEFLKDPKKFQRLGGRIPKGVLMVGPPGTGKTLLAKAIAGEADAAFFSISGSDFVEMFVGVGASRVRDMFEQARKNTPCLVFIDEIDAVGRSRGHGLGGGNDEREQTLNALLVEMDGFDTQEGIIIIAATNRPDVLDPGAAAPGPFRPPGHGQPAGCARARGHPEGARQEREAGAGGGPVGHRARHAGLFRRGAGQPAERSRAAGGQHEQEGRRHGGAGGGARQGPLGPRAPQPGHDRRGQEVHRLARGRPRAGQRDAPAHASAAQGHHHSARPVARLDHVAAQDGRPQPPPQGDARHDRRDDGAAASPRKLSPATFPAARPGDIQQATQHGPGDGHAVGHERPAGHGAVRR